MCFMYERVTHALLLYVVKVNEWYNTVWLYFFASDLSHKHQAATLQLHGNSSCAFVVYPLAIY